MEKKATFIDKIMGFVDAKLVPPLIKFAEFRPMRVIRNGMVSLVPMILVSSIFLILYMLGSPSGTSNTPLIPLLSPFIDKLLVVHNYGLSFLALYSSVVFGISFAKVYNTEIMSTALLSLNCFFAINLTDFIDGKIDVANFAGQGLIGCMLSSFIAGFVIYLCDKNKLEIKLPDSVPPEILSSFKAIIPFLIAVPITWVIRTVLEIDIAVVLNNVLGPIFSYADSPLGYGLYCFVLLLLWSVGIHGDNVLKGIIDPLTILWGAENAAAASSGVALTDLPHVWAYNLLFFHIWVAGIWPLAIYLAISKVKAYRAFGRTVAIPTFFICEPLIFGAPIVLNPLLFIPMILSGTISGVVSYLIMDAGFINRIFINLPWTTPQPLQVVMATGGDFKALIIPVVSFILGMSIYYPFIKAYEKLGFEKEREMELEQEKEKELALN